MKRNLVFADFELASSMKHNRGFKNSGSELILIRNWKIKSMIVCQLKNSLGSPSVNLRLITQHSPVLE